MENELWRWIWVGMAMLMGVSEIFTPGFFFAPFALGAAVAAVAAWVGFSGGVQWALFFGGTAASLLVLRRFMRSQDSPDDLPVGVNRYVGLHARVLETVDPVNNTGRIRVESEEWRATCDGAPIAQGSLVTVTAVRGTRLMVEFREPPPADYSDERGDRPLVADAVEQTRTDAVASASDDAQTSPPASTGP